jgi:uncharacterized protein YoxC
MMTILAQNSSFLSSDAAKIGAAIAFVLFVGGIFQKLRSLRKDLADELRRELQAGSSAQRIDVQSPLEVKQHAGVAMRSDVDRLDKELLEAHGRISRERKEIDRELTRITTDLTKRTDQLDDAIATNTKLTSEMKGKVDHMDQSLSSLNNSLTQFMRDQAKKS